MDESINDEMPIVVPKLFSQILFPFPKWRFLLKALMDAPDLSPVMFANCMNRLCSWCITRDFPEHRDMLQGLRGFALEYLRISAQKYNRSSFFSFRRPWLLLKISRVYFRLFLDDFGGLSNALSEFQGSFLQYKDTIKRLVLELLRPTPEFNVESRRGWLRYFLQQLKAMSMDPDALPPILIALITQAKQLGDPELCAEIDSFPQMQLMRADWEKFTVDFSTLLRTPSILLHFIDELAPPGTLGAPFPFIDYPHFRSVCDLPILAGNLRMLRLLLRRGAADVPFLGLPAIQQYYLQCVSPGHETRSVYRANSTAGRSAEGFSLVQLLALRGICADFYVPGVVSFSPATSFFEVVSPFTYAAGTADIISTNDAPTAATWAAAAAAGGGEFARIVAGSRSFSDVLPTGETLAHLYMQRFRLPSPLTTAVSAFDSAQTPGIAALPAAAAAAGTVTEAVTAETSLLAAQLAHASRVLGPPLWQRELPSILPAASLKQLVCVSLEAGAHDAVCLSFSVSLRLFIPLNTVYCTRGLHPVCLCDSVVCGGPMCY